MAIHDSNVVAFETLHARQKEGNRPNEERVIAECRVIVSDRLSELLQNFFTRIDDELFKLSDKAENSTLQSLYFESMRYVRREKDAIHGHYLQDQLQQYDDFCQNKAPQPPAQRNEEPRELTEDNFALLENETLEEDLAINSMIGKGNALFHHELFTLNKRFSALLSRDEGQIGNNNPVAPAALCRGFEAVLKPQAMDLKVKLLIYKLFDRLVLSAAGPVYHELNATLIKEGILPSITKTIVRQPKSLAGATRGELTNAQTAQRMAHTTQGGDSGENVDYLETFRAMQSLLDGWRSQLGLQAHSPDTQLSGVVFDSDEVLDALSVLQHPASIVREGGRAGSSEGLKLYVTDQLRKLQPSGQTRPLGRLEGDTIDMVAMIFDFILEDRNLPDPIKALIARLQIPVVKVAILEKSFFAKKNHPTRVLLNSLAQAGIGLDISHRNSETPIFKKIEEIVGRVLNEFDQNVDLFCELLEDFSAFMEKESQRSRATEERTRQVTQSKEQVRLAKKQVAYEIASRLSERETPAIVRSFLYNNWKDVLVLAYLRREKEAEEWEKALAVMDQLIWSFTPSDDLAGQQETFKTTPTLMKAIREGLESISVDPHAVKNLLRGLEIYQINSPSALYPAETAQESVGPRQAKSNTTPTSEVAIKDPELAQAILEIKANLPDIDDVKVEQIGADGIEQESVLEGSQYDRESSDDEYAVKARDVGIGEWLEFIEPQQKPWRAKLSWKSQVTSLYVFVNSKGVKVAEMSVTDLASQLRHGMARIIEGSTSPLMDRALSALMQSLKNPVIQSWLHA